MYRSYGYHLSLTCVYNKHNHSNHASLTALPTSNSMPTLTEQTSTEKLSFELLEPRCPIPRRDRGAFAPERDGLIIKNADCGDLS